MSRASDIRTYIIAKQPLNSIATLRKLVGVLVASVDSCMVLRKNNEKPPFTISSHGISFELIGNRLHTKEGIVFSAQSLESFKETLDIMNGPMNLGTRTFATLYPPVYNDLLLACANEEKDVARIISEIFSGLFKRYQNRSRAGANNSYQFKMRLITCPQRFITFELANMKFDDTDHASFELKINDQILEDAIGGYHRVPMPTPKVAVDRAAQALKSTYVEVETPDNYKSLRVALGKHGLTDREIEEFLSVMAGWLAGPKLSITISRWDVLRRVAAFCIVRDHNAWDNVSIVAHTHSKSNIIGTRFSAKELLYGISKRTTSHPAADAGDYGTIRSVLCLSNEEIDALERTVEKELTDDGNFKQLNAVGPSRLLTITPMVYTHQDVRFRLQVINGTGINTTLSLISKKDIIDSINIRKSIMDVPNDRPVAWDNIVEPKIGFWAKVKRLFK